MPSVWEKVKPWVLPTGRSLQATPKIEPGLYHFRRERGGQLVRYHLRVEHSGQALLLVAAVEVVRLTQTGAIVALGILENKSESEILSMLGNLLGGEKLIAEVRKMIAELGLPNKRYPIFNLIDPTGENSPHGLIAPFQADLVLGDWDTVRLCLHALWNAGIPHVRFLPDSNRHWDEEQTHLLCSAIQLAEDIGMIAGVRMNASPLLQCDSESEKTVMDRICELGVDYVVVPWAVAMHLHERLWGKSDYAAFQPLVQAASGWEVTTVLEAGLTHPSVEFFEEGLDAMRDQGIEYVEVFALAKCPNSSSPNAPSGTSGDAAFQFQQLRQLAGWIEDLAEARRLQIVWLPPVGISAESMDEVTKKKVRLGPRAGADISIRVESDGRVIPPRGPYKSVGVIHRTPWPEIWNHPSFFRFRQMVNKREYCSECPIMTMCSSHCPADPEGWATKD